MKGSVIIVLLAILVSIFSTHAYPQAYPTKPVSLMVSYPPGGSTDVGARIVASLAEKDLGQPLVVLNRSGAGVKWDGRSWPNRSLMGTTSGSSTFQ